MTLFFFRVVEVERYRNEIMNLFAVEYFHMGVSKNRVYPQIIHFNRVFPIIFTIHFGGKIPLFLVQHPPIRYFHPQVAQGYTRQV